MTEPNRSWREKDSTEWTREDWDAREVEVQESLKLHRTEKARLAGEEAVNEEAIEKRRGPGRPRRSLDNTTIAADRKIATKLRIVAIYKGLTMGELTNQILGPIVQEMFDEVNEDLCLDLDTDI